MAVRIRSKLNEANDYAINAQPYEGGILSAIEVPPSSGVWCPIVVYDDAVSIGTDKLEVQTPKVVSDLFWAYDGVFVADTRINPTTTGAGAIPVLSLAASETTRDYTTANSTSSTATYKIALVNPNNYKVQFCTNVEGTGGTLGGTTGGFPANDTTAWVNIEPTGGFYLVRSLCSDSDDQTIYMRYERSGVAYSDEYRLAPNFPKLPPYSNTGGIPTGTGNAVAALNGVPLLAHVWGMFGNDNPTLFKQGTYQDDLCAIEEAARDLGDEYLKVLPFYATQNAVPKEYSVSRWVSGTDTQTKRVVYLNYNFLLTKEVMRSYIEYAIQAGIQGFMMLNYANDGYLSLFRRIFRDSDIDKRGLKICYSLNFGGEGRDTYDSDLANDTWNNGTAYRDTVYQFALDIKQSWYAKARKNGVQVPIIHALISSNGTMATDKASAWVDLQRIKARVLFNTGSPLGETFNVLMTSGPDISVGNADDTGEVWNAKTSYYLQPSYSDGFSASGTILDSFMGATNVAASNKVPMISWGYNSNPRWYFQNQESVSSFPYAEQVLSYMPTLINKLKTHMNDTPKDLRLALCGQVGEFAEQGRDLFPNKDGDRDMLNIFKAAFNPSYVIPT